MIKAAVIGAGSMGKNHARVYNELADAELVAVSDSNPEIAGQVAGRFGVKAYTDYEEMLRVEKPEAVTVSVPTAIHERVTFATLEAGAHALVEKPIAPTIESGRRMIEKAKSVNRHLMVGHIVRFNPAIKTLKDKLQSGDLGRIFQIICRRVGPFPARIRDVGVVIDLATHDVDLMRFLTGREPVRVFAETEQRIHTEHEDLLLGLLRFEGAITGALEINWLTPHKVREIIVLGERGMYRVDDLTQDLYFYENEQAGKDLWPPLSNLKGVSEGQMIRFSINRYEPLKAELETFLRVIKNEVPLPVTGEDGLAAVRIALALVESGKTHHVIEL